METCTFAYNLLQIIIWKFLETKPCALSPVHWIIFWMEIDLAKTKYLFMKGKMDDFCTPLSGKKNSVAREACLLTRLLQSTL